MPQESAFAAEGDDHRGASLGGDGARGFFRASEVFDGDAAEDGSLSFIGGHYVRVCIEIIFERTGRRRVEDHALAQGLALANGVAGDLERQFELHEQYIGGLERGQSFVHVGAVHGAVGARHEHDAVVAGFIHDDAGTARALARVAQNVVDVHARAPHIFELHVAEGVAAHAANHGHLGAHERGHHCLIRALAAHGQLETRAHDGFTLGGPPRCLENKVRDEASDYGDFNRHWKNRDAYRYCANCGKKTSESGGKNTSPN